ncbi:Hypothetical predicted protein [Pelobates cultripes]|uniref:Uncharacterized protein n=1 Tax=Pelobates cultripes TaxID=61616 RepID=A0AAD1TGT4_PELCU|nr:Hypothetical predicted protein [Pelobates cultripes]
MNRDCRTFGRKQVHIRSPEWVVETAECLVGAAMATNSAECSARKLRTMASASGSGTKGNMAVNMRKAPPLMVDSAAGMDCAGSAARTRDEEDGVVENTGELATNASWGRSGSPMSPLRQYRGYTLTVGHHLGETAGDSLIGFPHGWAVIATLITQTLGLLRMLMGGTLDIALGVFLGSGDMETTGGHLETLSRTGTQVPPFRDKVTDTGHIVLLAEVLRNGTPEGTIPAGMAYRVRTLDVKTELA